jgi:hypothetical protein
MFSVQPGDHNLSALDPWLRVAAFRRVCPFKTQKSILRLPIFATLMPLELELQISSRHYSGKISWLHCQKLFMHLLGLYE